MNDIEKIELLEHIAIAYKDDETLNNEFVSPQGRFIKNKELAGAIENLIKENKELKEELKRIKSLDINSLVEDYTMGQLIPKSKVKELYEHYKNTGYNELEEVLQELLEGE